MEAHRQHTHFVMTIVQLKRPNGQRPEIALAECLNRTGVSATCAGIPCAMQIMMQKQWSYFQARIAVIDVAADMHCRRQEMHPR